MIQRFLGVGLMANVQHLLPGKAKQMLWSISFWLVNSELRKLYTRFNSIVLLFDTHHP